MKTIKGIYNRSLRRKRDFYGVDIITGNPFMFFSLGHFHGDADEDVDVLKGTKYEDEVRNMRMRNPLYENRLKYELYKDDFYFSDVVLPFNSYDECRKYYERYKYYEQYKDEPEMLDSSCLIRYKTYIKEKYPAQFDRVVQIFEELADAGSADAADRLVCLYNCYGKDCNLQEYARRYKKVADKGTAGALETVIYNLRLCRYDSDEIVGILAPMIDSKASSVVFMWDLAVEAFYSEWQQGVPTKKYDALVRRLIDKISSHKDEKHSGNEEYVFRQLDDFVYYIDHPNLLEEVMLDFCDNNYMERYGERKCVMGEDIHGEFFFELPGIYREKGWRLGVRCRGVKNRFSCNCETHDCAKLMCIYAFDGNKNEDKAVFRHIVVENTVMGGWSMLLFMQKYMGLSVDWLVDKAGSTPFSIKPEDLGQGTCNDDDALDLFLPKSSLPYGKATMLGDDKCRIDIVFSHKSGKGQASKRVHAVMLLVCNRIVGLNAEEVKKKRTNFKNK